MPTSARGWRDEPVGDDADEWRERPGCGTSRLLDSLTNDGQTRQNVDPWADYADVDVAEVPVPRRSLATACSHCAKGLELDEPPEAYTRYFCNKQCNDAWTTQTAAEDAARRYSQKRYDASLNAGFGGVLIAAVVMLVASLVLYSSVLIGLTGLVAWAVSGCVIYTTLLLKP